MDQSSFGAFAQWLKSNPLVVFVGAVGTIVGTVTATIGAWHAGADVLNLPSCGTYAHVYQYSSGKFSQSGDGWVEVNVTETNRFRQLHRDKDYILLLNLTPRKNYRSDMLVRLPACGGSSQWTLQNPQKWENMYVVWRA